MQLPAQAEHAKEAKLKAKFEAEFGADPVLWEQFKRHINLQARGIYHTTPVSPRQFFSDPYYCGKDIAGSLYPEVVKALEECSSGRYVEAVMTGGIGVSKTTIALLGTFYQLYLLSCMRSPQKALGLIASDEIIIIFQSLNAGLARAVDFQRFKARVDESAYFKAKFMYDKGLTSELRFPHHIIVKPVTGSDKAAIGQNVIGGIIDEVNFMAVIVGSALSIDGGTFDQAQALYDSIRRRRESRFMQKGELPGMLFLVSSKRYPGQFTDRKADEARREAAADLAAGGPGRSKIFIYDKKIWEVQPQKFGTARFKVFKGDMTRQPYVVPPDAVTPPEDAHLIMDVPTEYKLSFEGDIMGSLRDIGGESTLALHPFIMDTRAVSRAFGRVDSILSREKCDFKATQIEMLVDLFRNPAEPRFVHLDLAIKGDSAGVACGHIRDFVKVERDGSWEVLPRFDYDFILEVAPPRGEEIIFSKIRTLIVKLREQGLNIRWVTLDSFQSRDTMQILRSAGFSTGLQSIDITPMPYTFLKSALMDDRVFAPVHPRAMGEIAQLEQDEQNGKIDHPPNGSKDCADAMAGVAHGLIMRRELWQRHNVLHLMPKEFVTPPKDIDKPGAAQSTAVVLQ